LVTASENGEPASLLRVRKDGVRTLYRGTGELLLDDIAPDGRVLVTQTSWRQEIEVTPDSPEPEPVDHLDWTALAAVSEDGKMILWGESGLGVDGKPQAFLHRGGQRAPVDLGPGRPFALSPDGREALVWRDGTPGSLWLVPTGPGDARELPVPGLLQIDSGAFFADGRRLALIGRPDPVSPNRLFVLDTKLGTVKPISPPGLPRFNFELAVSPDQRWISALDPEGIVAAYPVDGGEPIRATVWGKGHLPAGWLIDGTLLAFERFKVPSRIERFDLLTRSRVPFTTVAPVDHSGVVRIIRAHVTPDMRTTVLNHRRMGGVLLMLEWDKKQAPQASDEAAVADVSQFQGP